jgi:transposase InsO family protein
MDEVSASFPVPLKGIDSDNGREFINSAMKTWCEQREITFTRTRAYHKNDNRYVEQKNGDAVRKTVGYARYTNEGGPGPGVLGPQSPAQHFLPLHQAR